MAYDVNVRLASVRIPNAVLVQLDDLPGVQTLASHLGIGLRARWLRLELGRSHHGGGFLLGHAATSAPSGVTISAGAPWISASGAAITVGSPTTTMRSCSGCRCRWAARRTSSVVTLR